MLRYAKVRDRDISNGPGFRVSLFFQGCIHHCKNCFNPETWNPNGGYELTDDKINKILDLCDKDEIKGISLLGGDPFYIFDSSLNNIPDINKDRKNFINFLKKFKERFPNKTIWVWTGYLYDDCFDESKLSTYVKFALKYIDTIIDGPFIEEKKILGLTWRGSSNQKIIDVSNIYNV